MSKGGVREGAGRKRIPCEARRVPIAMRVSPACKAWLKDKATEYDLSLGEMVEQMMHHWREHELRREDLIFANMNYEIEHISDGVRDLFRIK